MNERYEKIGEHWTESIGIPGIPSSHFEIHHRTNGNVHFIDREHLKGPRGTSDVLKEIGVEKPRIYIDEENDAGHSLESKECRVPGIKNITDIMTALHESAHYARDMDESPMQSSFSGLPMPTKPLSLLQMKKLLESRDIVIRKTDAELEEFDRLASKFRDEYSQLSENDRINFTR